MTHREQITNRGPFTSSGTQEATVEVAKAASRQPSSSPSGNGLSPPLLLFDQRSVGDVTASPPARTPCTRSIPPVTTLGSLLAPVQRLASAPKRVQAPFASSNPTHRFTREV